MTHKIVGVSESLFQKSSTPRGRDEDKTIQVEYSTKADLYSSNTKIQTLKIKLR